MKDFLRRLGKTRFLILCFIPFGAWGLYSHGLLGLLATIFGWWLGWCLGNVIYNWKEYKPRLIRFFQRRTKFQIKLIVKMIILVPIATWCFWYAGWLGIVGFVAGCGVGELICSRFLKLN